jgi:hypothetical protein
MLRVRHAVVLAAACLAASALPAPHAAAEVRRCTTADGGTLYTDRPCAAVGAEERPGRAAGQGAGARPYRGGCPRRLQDLVFEVTTAIDGGDPNRLAAVYHWPGQSTRSGYAVMDRLDRITQRPLVDITALRPAAPVVVVEHRPGVSPSLHDDAYHPQAGASRPPVALRIDQTIGNDGVPSRTTFGLRRHMDCWWITL